MTRFWRKPRSGPATLPLTAPRWDASMWPADLPGARHGFDASTVHRIGLQEAFTPPAHAIADLIAERLIPLLDLDASDVDRAQVEQLLRTAAQIGAGIGLIEARNTALPPDRIGSATAGALGTADGELPPMPVALRRQARYLMHCGHHLARCGPEAIERLAVDLSH